MTDPQRVPVVVVGAGAAGLAVAAQLARRDVPAVVLERDARVGQRWAERYDRLHLHTHRLLSGMPDRRIPRSASHYVSKDVYAEYLAGYARDLELDVRLQAEVSSIERVGSRWRVFASTGDFDAEAVVLATGRYDVPQLPSWPDAGSLGKRLVHASHYRSGAAYSGQRVLVVGIGNSGAEIAADLVEQGAAGVAISVRTVPPISPRDIAGVPSQLLGIALAALPPRLADVINAGFRRLGPNLSRWGLDRPGWRTFSAVRPPVIDVGFLAQLRRGAIDVRPALDRFEDGDAVFADGARERFDAVVAATGSKPGIAALLASVPGVLDGHGLPLGPGADGLHFLGFGPTLRGQLLEIRRGAPRVASRVARELREMEQACGQQE